VKVLKFVEKICPEKDLNPRRFRY